MEGFMFSSAMIISPVEMDPCVGKVDEMRDHSVTPEYFASEMDPILEPYEGMEFESEEAARMFYNTYAAQMGFKARVSSFIRSKRDKTIISRQLVCSREGFRCNKDSNSEGKAKRPRMITRVGCRAMIMVKKQSSGRWVISKCERIHNHVLGTQGKVVMLDYDPYVREDEENIDNSLVEYHGEGSSDDTHTMVVVPPQGDPSLEPCLGMEFESENDAQVFYKAYARHVGFRARVSSYYRSKRDNSIISRLIVCSKEGFRAKKDEGTEERLQRPRAITRVGCKAMIMVKKRDSGKWVVSKLIKNHNHVLTPRTASDDELSEAEDDDIVEIEKALVTIGGETTLEPYEGMEFESEEAAKMFYFAYSRHVGFNMRVSTYYRSKRDKSIISRLFVCSKEGFYSKKDGEGEGKIKRPREATRVGCKAMLMVKKNSSGKWIVSKFEKDHNHLLGSLRKVHRLCKRKRLTGSSKSLKDEVKLQNCSEESPTSLCSNICSEAIKFAEAGAATSDVYNITMHTLQKAMKEVPYMKNIVDDHMEGSAQVDDLVDDTSSANQHMIARSSTRSSHGKMLRTRVCSTCMHATDHDSNSCPLNQMILDEPVDTISCEQMIN